MHIHTHTHTQIGDLAMKALRGADAASHEDEDGDGSWILPLQKVRVFVRACIHTVLYRVVQTLFISWCIYAAVLLLNNFGILRKEDYCLCYPLRSKRVGERGRRSMSCFVHICIEDFDILRSFGVCRLTIYMPSDLNSIIV